MGILDLSIADKRGTNEDNVEPHRQHSLFVAFNLASRLAHFCFSRLRDVFVFPRLLFQFSAERLDFSIVLLQL